MKKDELVQAIAEAADLSKADADRALKAVVESVTKALGSGDSVQIPGLGTFEPRARSAREGRNPQTGAPMKIKAGKTPRFTPGASLKRAVDL